MPRVTERPPPQEPEAERAVLGCCLLDGQCAPLARQLLREADFYAQGHRLIWRAIHEVSEAGPTPDQLTVADCLKQHRALKKIGGREQLSRLAASVASTANLEAYAKTVRDAAERRALLDAGHTLLTQAWDKGVTPSELRAQAEECLNRGTSQASQLTWAFDGWDPAVRKESPRFATGLLELDLHTGGLRPGVNLISGEPGHGKTTLGLQLLLRVLLAGHRACLFEIERSLDEVREIMAACHNSCPVDEIRKHPEKANDLRELPLRWHQGGGFELGEILAAIKLEAAQGTRWFMVDYLQAVTVPGGKEEWTQAAKAMKSIANLMHSIGGWCIAINSHTKSGQGMGRLRGEGILANAPHQIWWLQRQEDGLVDLEVMKSWSCAPGHLKLALHGAWHRFADRERP